jgi:hypothetical protein
VRARIAHAFRLALTRPPTRAEIDQLEQLYDSRLGRYRANAAESRAMATEPIGALPPGIDEAKAAALSVVGNVILNLDEFLTKG